jgi:glyoxylase-like metal-dependent hydrolase (beta-lactamase superfamily II)
MAYCGLTLVIGFFNKGGSMEITRINSSITAFIRPSEGANVGLISTPKGMVVIDTTSSPGEILALLEAAGIHVEEIKQVINTHFHSDHTWGNQVFSCPIVAQRQCLKRMQAALRDDWSMEELQAYIIELEKTDPLHAEDVGKMVANLKITLPDQLFDEKFMHVMGGLNYEIIHLGGHTPDTSIVWLPSEGVMFTSDLIFQGRYPYIFDADILAWIDALNILLEYKAKAIIPGHGVMCSEGEIIYLRDYLQDTWERTNEHVRLGHVVDEIVTDPGYPIFSTNHYDRLHQANIRYIYEQLNSLDVR